MNIKILDSWLREYLDTKASATDIARELSLTSVSIERTEKVGTDYVYDIEVTTNRPDLMSVIGIANEAAAVLPEQGIPAKFIPHKSPAVESANISFPIEIINDPKLVNRIMAVVMEVEIGESPKEIKDRLEASGIRSLNNLIDVTNYVMREIGHPCHVFDFDLLNTKQIKIRAAKKGEEVTTLDGKTYELLGGDIIAEDDNKRIIDLLGVMGTQNSVVQNNTKRIMFFLDNNNPQIIRKTSMSLGIRTEAAVINEKGIDPELITDAFKRGVELYKDIAKGRVVTKTLDLYPNKSKKNKITVSNEKVNKILGVEIDPKKSAEILEKLGFGVKLNKNNIEVEIPSIRSAEVNIDEDVIEEIARVYGYHKLPSVIPGFRSNQTIPFADKFYFEEKIKNALKYRGFTEVYTYSLISEDLFMGPLEKALKLKNPLSEDMVYLRNSLVPSLIQILEENKSREIVQIFELANIYQKRTNDLPKEVSTLSALMKKKNISFYEGKGIVEQILTDLGIKNFKFKQRKDGPGAEVLIEQKVIGFIEIFNNDTIDFELNFDEILKHASNKLSYKQLAKFPPVVEDITFVLPEGVSTDDVVSEIQLQSFLITEVTLKDQYEDSKTFHIIYQAEDKNLTNQEVKEIREQITAAIQNKFQASVK
ncbi:phenylalanine--tRNA ligase subunit beta [Candidatus Dojkabacteria bacterium]|uniref:Phenylalanine--tRNA ligase beta subunit n=1 Tax=Candidatus Dojkabacteria bacterium TaxID=2099670 RepID=A0A5C7J537_9BACT|nr:MAG: phenylalanine--tRNA ligase subunit beta [Candidatus Dojkabacteria bacterium]